MSGRTWDGMYEATMSDERWPTADYLERMLLMRTLEPERWEQRPLLWDDVESLIHALVLLARDYEAIAVLAAIHGGEVRLARYAQSIAGVTLPGEEERDG